MYMTIFSMALIILTIVVYFTFFKKEQKGKCPSIIKKRQETQIDRIQKERVKKEIENFLNYCGDEQPEIK